MINYIESLLDGQLVADERRIGTDVAVNVKEASFKHCCRGSNIREYRSTKDKRM